MEKTSIIEYVKKLGYNPPGDSTYNHIIDWMDWYKGDVEKFHHYTVYNGKSIVACERKQMGMAKTVCEDWANLILNEKVSIMAGKFSTKLAKILEKNNFQVRANQLVELTYALGTGAFVEYLGNDQKIIIDYIRADMIIPLSWENGNITECAFGSYHTDDGKEKIYLQIHRLGREGENANQYYIENRYVSTESGEELEVPEGIEPIVATGSELPMFQIFTPNIQNNIELDSPMGISVYADGIDQLKGCDIIYDSYINEFVLGKKRLIVPLSAAKKMMEQEGIRTPVFDPNDVLFYALPGDSREEMKITENNMTIRSSEHELGIQRALDLLSLKCGLGTGRYQFTTSGVKTATEVISDKSDLYQNLKKNEIPVRAAIIGMVQAIAFLAGAGKVKVTVCFDDSIIEDSNATIDKNIKLVNAGLRSKLSAIMEILQCDEATALRELERIAEEAQVTGRDIDWMQSDEDDEDTEEAEQKEEQEGTEEQEADNE